MDEVRNPRRCEILVFQIGGRRPGLRGARSLARGDGPVTPAGAFPIEWIINPRDTVVPVLDVRARSRVSPHAAERSDCLVVIGMGACPLAVRIDLAIPLKTLGAADDECRGRQAEPARAQRELLEPTHEGRR